MSNKESLRNWGIIIAILVATSVLTAVWPSLFGGGGGGITPSRVPVAAEQIALDTIPGIGPMLAEQLNVNAVNGFVLFGVLAAFFIGAVIISGIILAFLYRFLDNFIQQAKDEDAYKASEQALEKKVNSDIKEMRTNRKPNPMPSHEMPRWSVWATSLIIIMFGIFFGMMVMRTFYPTNELVVGDSLLGTLFGGPIINVSSMITKIVIVVFAIYLALRMRPRRLKEADTDSPSIPWDMIVVILTGLLVVGLGIGFAVYLNTPV
ncbi:MAG: hypothetical protein R3C62_04245 [Chloroflexota bacterium]